MAISNTSLMLLSMSQCKPYICMVSSCLDIYCCYTHMCQSLDMSWIGRATRIPDDVTNHSAANMNITNHGGIWRGEGRGNLKPRVTTQL